MLNEMFASSGRRRLFTEIEEDKAVYFLAVSRNLGYNQFVVAEFSGTGRGFCFFVIWEKKQQ